MARLSSAWRAMDPERRIAAIAAVGLLLTMFFPWYGLQSLNRKTGAIYSHNISAFGDVSFVEAAIFLVAAGVMVMLIARAEGREFDLPGGDGAIVAIAGGWATLLIFYRVFSRPDGHGYPVGIEWGFFLAFVAAGTLTYSGWRMLGGGRHQAPAMRPRRPHSPRPPASESETSVLAATPAGRRERAPVSAERAPVAAERGPLSAERRPRRDRPAYPPSPQEQLSFEDPPSAAE
jgi:hypothetical protein